MSSNSSVGHSAFSDVASGRTGTLLVPYLALVLVHILSGIQMEQPVILADEIGYLGNARYLSGTSHLPNMHGSQFYHFGYSLILLPVFWLFTDPVWIYKASIFINALLASSLYFPLYFILASFLNVPRSAARWVAFACCLYPSLLLYSSFAWAENAFVPFYAITTALFGKCLASPSSRDALLFGLSAGFLYTIHPRALPVLAIVLVYLVVLAVLNVVPKGQAVRSVVAMGVVFALTRGVNEHLNILGWGGGGEMSATKLAGRLVPGSDFPLLFERAMGQLLYLSLASHGLFLVGLATVIWLIVRNTASTSPTRVMATPRTGVPIFVLLTASGVFLASCTAKLYSVHGPVGVRGAAFIHGRYNEAFAVMVMSFALAAYCRGRMSNRRLTLAPIGVAATMLCLTAVVAREVQDAQRRHDPTLPIEAVEEVIRPDAVATAAVPAVYPLVGLLGGLKLYAMSLTVIGSFLSVTVAMRFSTRGGMVLLMLVFASFALYNDRHYLSRATAPAELRVAFVSQMSRIGPIDSLSYDVAHLEPEIFYGAQFLLPHTVFHTFDSRNREVPESEAVISGNKWIQARRQNARFVVSSGWDNALWVLPGEVQSRLPVVSYEDVTLGTEPTFGVQEAGFHLPTQFLGAPARWTNGDAALKVPLDPAKPLPEVLSIETIVPRRHGARLRVLANRVELWNARIPPEPWSHAFDLEGVPMDDELLIELDSDVFSGKRRLGVMVRGIRLTARDGLERPD